MKKIFNINNCKNVCIGNGNIINGKVVNGNINVVTENGVVITVNGVSVNYSQVCRSFECTVEDVADTLLFSRNNNCSVLDIIADDSVDRVTAEVKVTCSAPKKKKAEKMIENFNVKAETTQSKTGSIVCFKETYTFSAKASISTEYTIRVPSTLKNIIAVMQTGEMSVEGFEGDMSVSLDTGRIVANHCTLGSSDIKTATGEIRFVGNTVNKDVDLHTDTGGIRLSVNGGTGEVNAKAVTGEILLANSHFDTYRTLRNTFTGEEVFAVVNGCSITAKVITGCINHG